MPLYTYIKAYKTTKIHRSSINGKKSTNQSSLFLTKLTHQLYTNQSNGNKFLKIQLSIRILPIYFVSMRIKRRKKNLFPFIAFNRNEKNHFILKQQILLPNYSNLIGKLFRIVNETKLVSMAQCALVTSVSPLNFIRTTKAI